MLSPARECLPNNHQVVLLPAEVEAGQDVCEESAPTADQKIVPRSSCSCPCSWAGNDPKDHGPTCPKKTVILDSNELFRSTCRLFCYVLVFRDTKIPCDIAVYLPMHVHLLQVSCVLFQCRLSFYAISPSHSTSQCAMLSRVGRRFRFRRAGQEEDAHDVISNSMLGAYVLTFRGKEVFRPGLTPRYTKTRPNCNDDFCWLVAAAAAESKQMARACCAKQTLN